MYEKDDMFLYNLYNLFSDIHDIAIKKKYKVLVPPNKCIFNTMLTRNFYDNHIFCVSKYDDNMYINLNGKVLKLIHQQFETYLGWQRPIELKIKGEFVSSQGLSCILIDDICDETNTNTKTREFSNNPNLKPVQRYTTMKQYIENYTIQKYPEFSKAFKIFECRTDLLRNNIIFMKGHEEEYSIKFEKQMKLIEDEFRNCFSKSNASIPTDIFIDELVDSLVFNKLYDFIFGSLVEFNKQEEYILINKIKEFPNRYELNSLQVDKAYRDCKFEKAVALLKELSNKKCLFEKLVFYYIYIQLLITDINAKIAEEAKEAYERFDSKHYYNPESDVLLNFWSYVIVHSKLPNILAEAAFLSNFNFIGFAYGEASYLATTLITAIRTIYNDNIKDDLYKTFAPMHIPEFIINTDTTNIETKDYVEDNVLKK